MSRNLFCCFAKASEGEKNLKQFATIKRFCSASDKTPVVVDSTCTLTEFMLIDKIKTLGKPMKCECERFPKATFHIKFTLLLYRSVIWEDAYIREKAE